VRSERGFSLIEVLLAVGVISLIALGGVGLTLSSRSLAVSAAAAGFDALLDGARTTARAFDDGVTLAFVPDAYGDGFRAQLYQNRPGTATLVASTMPALEARVTVNETETLGAPSFALTIHGNGDVAGIVGGVLGQAGPETPCPASGAYHFVFSYAAAHADRYVACRLTLAATGPAVIVTPPPAVPLPLPTAPACTGAACASVPTAPPSAAATPFAVAIYFAGPTAKQVNTQSGSPPQPCASFPIFYHSGGNTGDDSSGGWYEDDWYIEGATTTLAAFVAQHLSATGAWVFDGDGFGKPNGTYLDPTQVGAVFHVAGTYGAFTAINASSVPLATLATLAPSSAVAESDYLHESCFAAWSDTPGGGG
jgi:prepilin-type N-terminal cleavage/methylation domain-containing protein